MTRHRDLEAELHPSVRAARDLRATADLWPQLRAALAPGSAPQSGGKRTKRDAAPLPIVAHVSDEIERFKAWTYHYARILAEETDWTPPDTTVDHTRTRRLAAEQGMTISGSTTPPRPTFTVPAFQPSMFGKGGLTTYITALRRPVYKIDVPATLRALAERVGHFTQHPDELVALEFVDECHDLRRDAEAVAYPSGARRIPLHFACLECDGSYTALLLPDQRWQSIPDLQCDKDRRHSITPAEWQRLERRRLDPGAARAFLQRLRGVA